MAGAAPTESVSNEFRPRRRWWLLASCAYLGVWSLIPWGAGWPWTAPLSLPMLVLAVRYGRVGVRFDTDSVIIRQSHKTRAFRRSEIAAFSAGQALNAFNRPGRVARLELHLGGMVRIGELFDDALVDEVVAYGNAWLGRPGQA